MGLSFLRHPVARRWCGETAWEEPQTEGETKMPLPGSNSLGVPAGFSIRVEGQIFYDDPQLGEAASTWRSLKNWKMKGMWRRIRSQTALGSCGDRVAFRRLKMERNFYDDPIGER